MTQSVSKIVFGAPTAVKIGAYGTVKGSCVDLGYTKGGVAVEYPREYYNVEVDQEQGDAVDIKIIRRGCALRFSLAQAQVENLRYALDLDSGLISGNVLTIGTSAEQKMTLFLDGPGPDGGTREMWIPKSVIINGGGHSYTKDGEVMVELELKVIFDTAQSDGEELGKITDSGVDTTAPTIALAVPTDGGTVTKDTSDTVTWQITETNVIDESTIEYGNTFQIINTTTPGSATLVAGTLTYDAATKIVTFTPSSTWTASDTFQVTVSTGLKDIAGNSLATPKIEQFSVTA